MVYKYIDFVKDNGYFEYRRNEQAILDVRRPLTNSCATSFYHNPQIEAMLTGKEKQVLQGNLTFFCGCQELAGHLFCRTEE